MKYLLEHWELFLLAFVMAEKIVKITPCKWDDILFDIIFKTVKDLVLKNKTTKKVETK